MSELLVLNVAHSGLGIDFWRIFVAHDFDLTRKCHQTWWRPQNNWTLSSLLLSPPPPSGK